MTTNPNCTACPLHLRAITVCVPGRGPQPAEWAIFGMNPGSLEDVRGQVLIGPSGEILQHCLPPDAPEPYLSNVVKCHSGKTKPDRTQLAVCSDLYLRDEIEEVQPKVIVALGDMALLALTNRSGVNRNRGQWLELRPGLSPVKDANIPVLATFHPAAYLHSGRDERILRAIKADLQTAVDFLNGGAVETLEVTEGEPQGEYLGLDVETDRDGRLILGTIADSRGVFTGDLSLDRTQIYVAWNARFDLRVLQEAGVDTTGVTVLDPMLALHLLHSGMRGRYGLEAAVLDEFGCADKSWLDAKRRVHAGEILPAADLLRYCAQDSTLTARLAERLFGRLDARPALRRLYDKIVMPAMHYLAAVERATIPMDVEYIRTADAELEARGAALAAEMAQMVGLSEVPKFRSNRVLADIIYKTLKLPIVKMTDTGAPSTDKATLMELRKMSPFIGLLIEYKRVQKLRSSYTARWLKVLT